MSPVSVCLPPRRRCPCCYKSNGVRKYYGAEPVLDSVSFEVRDGERLALVGPNGAGKTTLLRILTGQEDPDAGQVALRTDARMEILHQQAEFAEQDTVWSIAESALAPLIALAEEAGTQVAEQLAQAAGRACSGSGWASSSTACSTSCTSGTATSWITRSSECWTEWASAARPSRQPVRQLSGGQQSRLLLARLLLARARS